MQAYALNDEQREIQALVRRLARDKVAARAADIDRSAEYPQDMFELLREVGLCTIPFPKEYGGTGSMLSAKLSTAYLRALEISSSARRRVFSASALDRR